MLSNLDAQTINPHIAIVTKIEEPPDEKNGKGIPVVGKTPTTTATFINDCPTITNKKPKTAKAENLSEVVKEHFKTRQAKQAKRIK